MKNYSILLMILAILTVIYSCQNSNNSTSPPTGPDNASGHATLAGYEHWLSSLDTQNINNINLAVRRHCHYSKDTGKIC
ncbi:MAG TPA: hypothetical protein VGM31_14120 [Puia sp.]|jgi:hypothetical protein